MAASGPERVAAAAEALSLAVEVRRMPAPTRTAEDAAAACGCALGQIVKSLVFQVRAGRDLRLLLVSGASRVDIEPVEKTAGLHLDPADPRCVRAETGFAIGSVPPIGHANPIPVPMDRDLVGYSIVWAAAGAPDAVSSVVPQALRDATGTEVTRMA